MCEEIFVTEEKSFTSYAIISTEWHKEKKDYSEMILHANTVQVTFSGGISEN